MPMSLSRKNVINILGLVSVFFLTTENIAAQTLAAQPTSSKENASFQLTLKDAEEAAAKALQDAGVEGNISATINSTRQAVLYYHHHPLTLQFKTIKFDKLATTWSANILILDGEEVLSAIPASGRYELMELIPVVKKRVKHGDVIQAEDIEMRAFPARRLQKEIFRNAAELENHTPKRVISPLRPVRTDEIQMPDIIHKGDLIKMLYKTSSMEISTQGEALEDGEIGKTIRVKNVASNKTIRGIVSGEKEVSVGGENNIEEKKSNQEKTNNEKSTIPNKENPENNIKELAE